MKHRLLGVIVTAALVACLYGFVEGRAYGHSRHKRIVATGNGDAVSSGNDTVAGNEMQGVQDLGTGDIGVNFTSFGRANGTQSANVTNGITVGIDYENGTIDLSQGAANVLTGGSEVDAISDIDGILLGPTNTIDSYQEGNAAGAGDTWALINGSVIVVKNNTIGNYSIEQSRVDSKAGGSQSSNAGSISDVRLSWEEIEAALIGSAVGVGTNEATGQVDIEGTNTVGRGVVVNGLMTGTGGERVSAAANGVALLRNETQELENNMFGEASGPSSGTLVGAGNLESYAETNQTMQTFGEGIADIEEGWSDIEGELVARLNSSSAGEANGLFNTSAIATSKNLTVSNGIDVSDNNGETLALGNGWLTGVGTENTSAIFAVESSYNNLGEAEVLVDGRGTVKSFNDTSKLTMVGNAIVENSNGVDNMGKGTAMGAADGEINNVTGRTFLNVNNFGANGDTFVDAQGGGANESSAASYVLLELSDMLAGDRNLTSAGNVMATGEKTYVRTIAGQTDYAGSQTFQNYQNATSWGEGGSSSTLTGVIQLKKRKKRQAIRTPIGRRYQRVQRMSRANFARAPTLQQNTKKEDEEYNARVQDIQIMRICVDHTVKADCPLFMKIRDPVNGNIRWKHVTFKELVEKLYGKPATTFVGGGTLDGEPQTTIKLGGDATHTVTANENSWSARSVGSF